MINDPDPHTNGCLLLLALVAAWALMLGLGWLLLNLLT